MKEQEIIDLMVNSMNEDNRLFSKNMGMSDDQIEKSIADSQNTLRYMMKSIYSKMVNANLINL